jgi:hypothetical protein
MNKFITFLVISLTIAYTLAVKGIDPDRLMLWLNTLVGTTISALLALITAMAIFETQSKAKAKITKDNMTKLLQAELSDARKAFDNEGDLNITISTGAMKVLVTNVQPLVIEKAALSGIYSETDSE